MRVRSVAWITLAVFLGLYATGNDVVVTGASALLGGFVVHEGAHYVVALAAGRRPWLATDGDGRPIETVWEVPDGVGVGDALAMAAPILLGAAVGLWALLAGGMPGWAVAGWLLMFSGSEEDWEGAKRLAMFAVAFVIVFIIFLGIGSAEMPLYETASRYSTDRERRD